MKTLNIIVISMIMLSSYAINATYLIIKKSGPEPFSAEITFTDGKTIKTKTVVRYDAIIDITDISIKALKIHSTRGTKEFNQATINKINELNESGPAARSIRLNMFINDEDVFAFEVYGKLAPHHKAAPYGRFEGKL